MILCNNIIKHPFLLLVFFLIYGNSSYSSGLSISFAKSPDTSIAIAADSITLIEHAFTLFDEGNYEEFLAHSEEAVIEAEKLGRLDLISHLLYTKGVVYRIFGNYSQSLRYFYLSLEHYRTLGYTTDKAFALNHIGSIYRLQGNNPGALEHFFSALSLFQNLDHKRGEASALNNIGIVYFYQRDYKKALEYYKASLEIEEELEEGYGISISYINIGEAYKNLGDYKMALDYYLKALVLAKKYEHEDKDGDSIGILYNEIGSIYLLLDDSDLSNSYLNKAYEIFNDLGNRQRLAESELYLGDYNLSLSKYNAAKSYYHNALNNAKAINAIDLMASANEKLSIVYEIFDNPSKAFKHYKEFIMARDSIFSEGNTKRMVQAEMLYKFEKQMQEAKLEQTKRDVKAQEKVRRQVLLRNFLGLILILLLLVVGVIFSAYKAKRKTNQRLAAQQEQIIEKNEELMQQQEEILSQRDEIEKKNLILENSQQIIEAKNERIISSIEYAQTIQQAILPNREQLNHYFPEHLVVFLPKDIVSGDFYWFSTLDNLLFAAVIDCTGHGVPGAFMSLIGNTMLNKIVNEWQTRDPALILELMHIQVRKVLGQDKSQSKAHAGMDICLVSIDKKKSKATFAGASRPLYLIQDGEVLRIQGDPRSVGGIQLEEKRYFTNHEIELTKTTSLYLTTDGFMDQMNGSYKKFGQRNFVQMIKEIHVEPTEKQEKILLEAFEHHRKGNEQIDDICILGLKI